MREAPQKVSVEPPFSLGLVAPLPPPAGGMANQARQLIRLWGEAGQAVEVVCMNPPYRPSWIARVPGVRALFRLVPYIFALWRMSGKVDVIHIFANSGWSWHLFTAPAVWIASWRGTPAIVNYRGGAAEAFFERSWASIAPTVKRASKIIVPSGFLQQVFSRWRITTEIVPNIIDLDRFGLGEPRGDAGPHVISTRNLESIYDVATTLRGFAGILATHPSARLSVAGRGPERENLERLAADLGIAEQVVFLGNLDNDQMVALYKSADAMVNTSRVDNMPISILESLACGVPVVTSDAGGIPFIVEHGKTALLVAQEDPAAVTAALLQVLDPGELRESLIKRGLEYVQNYAWPHVSSRWRETYRSVIAEAEASG